MESKLDSAIFKIASDRISLGDIASNNIKEAHKMEEHTEKVKCPACNEALLVRKERCE